MRRRGDEQVKTVLDITLLIQVDLPEHGLVLDMNNAEIVFAERVIVRRERVEVLDGSERLIDKGGPAALTPRVM